MEIDVYFLPFLFLDFVKLFFSFLWNGMGTGLVDEDCFDIFYVGRLIV